LKRLFKPFAQEDKTISKKYGGTGLGLCICHDLVSIMNGSIKVESQRRVGTTFTIKIPMKRSNDISGMVDDQELDLNLFDLDLASFEFVLINNPKSFELQQIKRALSNVGQQPPQSQVLEPSQIKNGNLFQRTNSIKSVLIDYITLKSKRQLLSTLSNIWDDVDLNGDPRQPSNGKIMKRIPIIVLCSEFENEQKVPKGDQIFMLKAPLDQVAIQKMMITIQKYYYSRPADESPTRKMDPAKELDTCQKIGHSEVTLPLLGLCSNDSQHSSLPKAGSGPFKFGRLNTLQNPDNQLKSQLGKTRKVSHNPNVQPQNKLTEQSATKRDMRKQNSTKLLREENRTDPSEMEFKT